MEIVSYSINFEYELLFVSLANIKSSKLTEFLQNYSYYAKVKIFEFLLTPGPFRTQQLTSRL